MMKQYSITQLSKETGELIEYTMQAPCPREACDRLHAQLSGTRHCTTGAGDFDGFANDSAIRYIYMVKPVSEHAHELCYGNYADIPEAATMS